VDENISTPRVSPSLPEMYGGYVVKNNQRVKEMLDTKLLIDTNRHNDSPRYDKDGEEIEVCKDCGCENQFCRCDGEDY